MKRRRHVQHLLSAYIDGELSRARRLAVEAHLIDCPDCARELERWRAMLRLVSFHGTFTCPIDCAEVVLRRLERDDAWPDIVRPALRRPLLSLSRSLSFATAAAVLAGALWLGAARLLRLTVLGPPSRVIAAAGAPENAGPGWRLADGPKAATKLTAPGAPPSIAVLASPGPMLRVHAPDRLQEAFGRSDSLILASDFSEDDR